MSRFNIKNSVLDVLSRCLKKERKKNLVTQAQSHCPKKPVFPF